jgi:hypothetical protein
LLPPPGVTVAADRRSVRRLREVPRVGCRRRFAELGRFRCDCIGVEPQRVGPSHRRRKHRQRRRAVGVMQQPARARCRNVRSRRNRRNRRASKHWRGFPRYVAGSRSRNRRNGGTACAGHGRAFLGCASRSGGRRAWSAAGRYAASAAATSRRVGCRLRRGFGFCAVMRRPQCVTLQIGVKGVLASAGGMCGRPLNRTLWKAARAKAFRNAWQA